MTSLDEPGGAEACELKGPLRLRQTSIDLHVNGHRYEVDVEPELPLLYVLRNHLGLLGTRFGCGIGLCGACFVLIDGRAVASCQTPVAGIGSSDVTTIEKLSEGSGHPVQQALLDHQAAQCGYCISGIVVSAVALLQESGNPTAAEVAEALNDNLCRCGAHNRIIRAVLAAATALRVRHPVQSRSRTREQ